MNSRVSTAKNPPAQRIETGQTFQYEHTTKHNQENRIVATPWLQTHAAASPRKVGMYATRRKDSRTPQGWAGNRHHQNHPQRENIRPIPSIMRVSDNGFKIVTGRPRKKPWEQKASLVIRLEQETYQRIRRLADKRKCSVSQAVELLIRTADSEKIEPTLPVDYSHILNKGGSYTVSQLLNLPR